MDDLESKRQNQGVRRRLIWVILILSLAAYIPLIVWGARAIGYGDFATWFWFLAVVPSMIAAGLIMILRRPDNPIGEIALWGGISMFLIPSLLETPTLIIAEESGPQEWMWAPMWLGMTLGIVGFVLVMALVVLLPDGRIRFLRERRFLQISSVAVLVPTLSLFVNENVVTHSQSYVGLDAVPSPMFLPALEPVAPVTNGLGGAIYSLFLGAVVLQFKRYRHGSERERKQVRWVLFGGVTAIAFGVLPSVLETMGAIAPITHGSALSWLLVMPLLLFMGSVVISVLEPPWVDVDIVIRKSFVYGALSFLILLLYIAVAASFGVAAGARLDVEIAVVLTVIIALLFQPARRRLQTVADRWVFGARPTKYEAVTGFGETIGQAADPEELLPQLADTTRGVLGLRWVTAELDDGSNARSGEVEGDPSLEVPIGTGHEQFGTILCGPKQEGSIDSDEEQLVRTLARQAGLAVMNARLASRVVNAAEAERRRIERNIHDGAQQELVALVARLGMAKSLAGGGLLTTEEVEELQHEAQRILFDLRELAQGIHPSVLSDGGILEAVEERCAHLPIDISIDARDGFRNQRFDDDIEGAAYFFITESLANVLKHAGATQAHVSLRRDGTTLSLSVSDDGCGFDPETARHNGLAGLRDRLQALGGRVSIDSRPGHGTRIEASLPVE